MKKFNNIYLYVLGVALAVTSILSCDRLIYDDLEACPRGVYINVLAQTECADTPTYPAVKQLNIFAFDENDVFVGTQQIDNPALSADYELLMPVEKPGNYSFIVWGGINDQFTIVPSQSNTIKKQDLLLQLKEQNKKAEDLTGIQVYVGTTPRVNVGLETDMFVHTKANIRETTNRIKVSVEDLKNSENYVVELHSGNIAYSFGGTIINKSAVEYPTQVLYPNSTTLTADFTTLKLEDGRNSILVVKEKETGVEIFRENLIGVILLSPSEANINLRCLNDFEVKLKMRHCNCPGSFEAAELWINDWMVHSYDTVLG